MTDYSTSTASSRLKKLLKKTESLIRINEISKKRKREIRDSYISISTDLKNIKKTYIKSILNYFNKHFDSLRDDINKTTKERDKIEQRRNNLLKEMVEFFLDEYEDSQIVKKFFSDTIYFENKKRLATDFFSKLEIKKEQIFFENEESKKIDKLPIDNKKCKNVYSILKKNDKGTWHIIKDQIGDQSAVGRVYNACLNDDCDFIIKIVSVFRKSHILWLPELNKKSDYYGNYKSDSLTSEHMLNEIYIQMEMSKYNLAPKIFDAFYCLDYLKDIKTGEYIQAKIKNNENIDSYFCKNQNCYIPVRTFYIMMEKFDISINGFLKILKKNNISLMYEYLKILKNFAYNVLEKSHKIGIIHGDSHIANFMFKYTQKGRYIINNYKNNLITADYILKNDIDKDFFGSFKSLVLIDFGLSINKISDKLILNDKKNIDETFSEKYIY